MNATISNLVESVFRRIHAGGFWCALLGIYLSVLGFLSLNPWIRPASGVGVLAPDKIGHALAYGGLSIIIYFCLAKSRNGVVCSAARNWLAAIAIAVLIGVLIEIAQTLFISNRTGSVKDATANAVGAVFGSVAWYAIKYLYTKTIMPK